MLGAALDHNANCFVRKEIKKKHWINENW